MATKYFRTVIGRHTLSELWRLCEGNVFVFVVAVILFKVFRANPEINFAQARINTLNRVEAENVSPLARNDLERILNECANEGVKPDFIYTVDQLTADVTYGILLTSTDARSLMQVLYARSIANDTIKTVCTFSCVSYLRDGNVLVTINQKRLVDSSPKFIPEYYPGASVRFILDRHRTRLDVLKGTVKEFTQEEMPELTVRLNNDYIDYSIQRGTAEEISELEVQNFKKKLGIAD